MQDAADVGYDQPCLAIQLRCFVQFTLKAYFHLLHADYICLCWDCLPKHTAAFSSIPSILGRPLQADMASGAMVSHKLFWLQVMTLSGEPLDLTSGTPGCAGVPASTPNEAASVSAVGG